MYSLVRYRVQSLSGKKVIKMLNRSQLGPIRTVSIRVVISLWSVMWLAGFEWNCSWLGNNDGASNFYIDTNFFGFYSVFLLLQAPGITSCDSCWSLLLKNVPPMTAGDSYAQMLVGRWQVFVWLLSQVRRWYILNYLCIIIIVHTLQAQCVCASIHVPLWRDHTLWIQHEY